MEGEEGRRETEREERGVEEREKENRRRGADARNFRSGFHSHRGREERGRGRRNYGGDSTHVNGDKENDTRQRKPTGAGRGVRNRDNDNRVDFVNEHGAGSR